MLQLLNSLYYPTRQQLTYSHTPLNGGTIGYIAFFSPAESRVFKFLSRLSLKKASGSIALRHARDILVT